MQETLFSRTNLIFITLFRRILFIRGYFNCKTIISYYRNYGDEVFKNTRFFHYTPFQELRENNLTDSFDETFLSSRNRFYSLQLLNHCNQFLYPVIIYSSYWTSKNTNLTCQSNTEIDDLNRFKANFCLTKLTYLSSTVHKSLKRQFLNNLFNQRSQPSRYHSITLYLFSHLSALCYKSLNNFPTIVQSLPFVTLSKPRDSKFTSLSPKERWIDGRGRISPSKLQVSSSGGRLRVPWRVLQGGGLSLISPAHRIN